MGISTERVSAVVRNDTPTLNYNHNQWATSSVWPKNFLRSMTTSVNCSSVSIGVNGISGDDVDDSVIIQI